MTSRRILLIGDDREIREAVARLRDEAARALGGHPLAPTPPRLTGPDAVACPRCGVAPGQPCKRGTLGRHPYHLARVEADRG